ncbi:ESPR-type extended signal peptide-containing protein, partial [Caballeronia sordidicola]|uniref:ESPR-type extended signal peptide-containing protein n=1 Tax=Caballeronia sordidicola TaxID=196367 RepID=UPI00211A03E4
MNKVFKSVWSEALGAWVAASELCRGRGKGGGKVARAVALAVALGMAGGAFAAGAGTSVSNASPATATNLTDIAIGSGATAASKTKDAIAIGDTAASSADGAISIGGSVSNAATNSILMGNAGVPAGTTGQVPVASIDAGSTASVFFAPAGGSVQTSANSFSFNPYAGIKTSGSPDSVNISGTVSAAPSSVAIGSKSSVTNTTAAATAGVAVGANASVQALNSVAIGANSVANRVNSFSVGGNGTTRVITQVSNGTKANDAVNMSQIQNIVDGLGGGAEISADGSITTPSYSVNGSDVPGVGQAISALDSRLQNAVMYDGVTSSVTLAGTNGTQIHNVAAATTFTDAVNFKQLTDAGLIIDTTGVVTNAFVAYTDKTESTVSLGGSGGTTIKNLAAGVEAQDAVNVKQLTDAGAIVDSSGTVTNGFVAYDGSAKDSVTLKGSNGTQIHKVAAGTTAQDAVNVKQLTDAGAVVDSTGTVTNAFVAYDGSAKDSVTLKGSNGTQIHKVAAGTTAQDAVNVKQLTDAGAVVDSTGTVTNAFVAYDGSAKDSVTLKGSNGTQIHKVAAGTTA